MVVDVRHSSAPEGAEDAPPAPVALPPEAAPAPSWALLEELDAVRVVLRGAIGPRETVALDDRLEALRPRQAPLLIDLTAVTELHEHTVTWLGLRHAQFGRERPVLVSVISDSRIHARLTRRDAPQLRLTLE